MSRKLLKLVCNRLFSVPKGTGGLSHVQHIDRMNFIWMLRFLVQRHGCLWMNITTARRKETQLTGKKRENSDSRFAT